jgi:hypothetical protein
MQTSRKYLFFIFTLLLVCVAAYGQGTTSTLSGRVTSAGSPLPGVMVSVSSPALQGTRDSVTGEGGGYTFAALPPGMYTVKFELAGMQTVTKTVQLTLAQASSVNADMSVGGVTESITVTASAPAVLETPGIQANFSQEMISKLPIARNIRQTVLLAPGVNANGVNNQITINGASSAENIFLVNGVVVNENLRGQPHNLFIEDAIQETSVLSAGISAEYGRFTGGVVSTLTKSGGNEFSGSFRDSLTNPEWTADVDIAGFRPPEGKINHVYEATLGGRVIRDRLWFFGAGRKAKTEVARNLFQTGIPVLQTFDEKRYEGKLTGQITAKHSVVGSYLDLKNTEGNNIFGSVYDLASVVPSRDLPNKLQTASYSGVLTNSLLIEAAWSAKDFAFVNSGGRFTDRIRGTWVQDSVTGAFSNAPVFCGVCTAEERNSNSIGGKASYFISTRAFGSHNIVVGGDRFEETRIANNFQSASQFQISARVFVVNGQAFPRFDNTTQLSWRPIFVLTPGTDFASDSIFINDRWELNPNFSFNIGLRWDKNDGKDADGTIVSDDSAISPRLGVMYDIRGDGRQRISASFGRYAAKITDGNVGGGGQAAGNPALFTYAYGGPAVNPTGTPNDQLLNYAQALEILFNWFDSIGGTSNTDFIASLYPGFNVRFPEGLKSPSHDEITLGYGVQLTRNSFVRLDAVRREWQDFYASLLDSPAQRLVPPNGVPNDVIFAVNDNDFTEREYTGVTVQGSWSPGRFNLGGNYTWSELKGNDVSEGAGTATIRNTPGELFYPEYLAYDRRRPNGYLDQDRRHRARLWAGYDFVTPIGNINLSVIENFDSGFAYSARGDIDATGRNANFRYTGLAANPGYTLSAAGTLHDYFFSDRGEFRTADRLATDFAIGYTVPIFQQLAFFLRADVLNVFDTQEIVNPAQLNTSIITSRTGGTASGLKAFNPFTETPIECPQGAPASQCSSMGAHWQKGPLFGQPNSADALQVADRSLAPRTYRFTLGLRF